MEVKETAACGISLREFAIEFDDDELVDMYRILNYAQNEVGFYDEDFLDDIQSQMSYIIGPSLDEEPSDDIEETILIITNGHNRMPSCNPIPKAGIRNLSCPPGLAD